MQSRIPVVVLLSASLCAGAGCVMVDVMKDATVQTWRAFRPKPTDWDPGDDPEKEWDFVGDEARPFLGHERDPDRWYKNYVMSPKANSIERNLGID